MSIREMQSEPFVEVLTEVDEKIVLLDTEDVALEFVIAGAREPSVDNIARQDGRPLLGEIGNGYPRQLLILDILDLVVHHVAIRRGNGYLWGDIRNA